MKRTLATALSLLLYFTTLQAQQPVVEWSKPLGGLGGDYGHSIEPTSDGGFIVGGYSEYPSGIITGNDDPKMYYAFWIYKLKSDAQIEWQKCVGSGYAVTYGASVKQTPDGGYIALGSTTSSDCNLMVKNKFTMDYLLVKLSANGEIEWYKSYGGSENDYGYSVDLTSDGGYVIAGNTLSNNGDLTTNQGDIDAWVLKVNGQGDLLWQKSLGSNAQDEAQSVRATPDGGCIMVGYNGGNGGDVNDNHGKWDGWVVKYSATGNVQWQKSLGGTGYDLLYSIELTSDGGYIIAGQTGSNDGDVSGNHHSYSIVATDFWVVKLSPAGGIQWQKCYGGNYNERAYCIRPAFDGGYLVTGYSESSTNDVPCNAGLTDIWVIKISSTGILQWTKSLGGSIWEEGAGIVPLNDGSCVVAGHTCSQNVAGYTPSNMPLPWQPTCADYWIVKLSPPVNVVPDPVVTIDPASAIICAGTSNTIKASVKYGGINPAYRWEKNGVPVGLNQSTYTDAGLVANDRIKCYVKRGGPCETSFIESASEVILQVNPVILHPTITISADITEVCECTTVTATATVTNAGTAPVYRWYISGNPTGITGPVYKYNSLKPGDNLTCTLMDISGCIPGNSVVSNTVTIKPAAAKPPTITISTPTSTICAGSPAVFTAVAGNAGTNPSYQWKINGNNAGTNNTVFSSNTLATGDIVSCTITTQAISQCITTTTANSNNITMSITTQAAPVVTISTPTNTICANSPAIFTATTSNAGNQPSYQWKVNGINTGANNKTFTSTLLADGDIVTCTINVDPQFTCATTTTATSNLIQLTVTSGTIPAISIQSSANGVCAGTIVNFTAIASNAGQSPSFQWQINNNPVGSNSPDLSLVPKKGDMISCVLKPGANTCLTTPVQSNIISPLIFDLPVVRINPMDTIIPVGTSVVLTGLTSGTVSSFQWTPSSKLLDPGSFSPSTIALLDNTIYELKVTDNNDCSSSAKATVNVTRPLYMPSGFTPNNDGHNDVYRIPANVPLTLKEFSIFDRWGNRIFRTTDISKGWDGKLHGTPSDTGVFIYMIKGYNDKGDVSLKGSFTLIR